MFGCILIIHLIPLGVNAQKNCIANIDEIRFESESLDNFDALSFYTKYNSDTSRKLNFLTDSLDLIKSDTLIILICPCFSTKGLIFDKRTELSSYIFDFVGIYGEGPQHRIDTLGIEKSCPVFTKIINLLTQRIKKTKLEDYVIISHDCPLDFFIKLGKSYYYVRISFYDAQEYRVNTHLIDELGNELSDIFSKFRQTGK